MSNPLFTSLPSISLSPAQTLDVARDLVRELEDKAFDIIDGPALSAVHDLIEAKFGIDSGWEFSDRFHYAHLEAQTARLAATPEGASALAALDSARTNLQALEAAAKASPAAFRGTLHF